MPIILTCVASPDGVGSVLNHVLPDGRETPVEYPSRTLTSAERNDSQIDKEALSIVSAVKKFHNFLYGHSFTIITDHKHLQVCLTNLSLHQTYTIPYPLACLDGH